MSAFRPGGETDMPTPATIAGLWNLGTTFLGGLLGNSAQKTANRTNIMLQQRQQAWEKEMSGTAWQRGVEDMKKAGINPMLAVSQGGASTPNVSAATVQPVDSMARAVGSSADKIFAIQEAKQREANIHLTEANAKKAEAEAITAKVTSSYSERMAHYGLEKLRKDIEGVISQFQLNDQQRTQLQEMVPVWKKLAEQQAYSTEQEGKLRFYQIPSAKAEAELWSKIEASGKAMGFGANLMKDVITILKSVRR